MSEQNSKINILVNEQSQLVNINSTAFDVRDQFKPDADIVIYNASPITENVTLTQDDRVVLIKRGEIPSRDQLEALMCARHTPGVHEKLKQGIAGIAGLGGLGSAIAIALCRIGVGKLILADFDIVEPSNLNRQQYFVSQIGMTKSQALTENLKQINPFIEVESHCVRISENNIEEIFGSVDVMIEAFDTPDSKAMILESFAENHSQTPLILASGLAGFKPNNTIKTRKLGDSIYVVGDTVTEAKPGMGLLAPRVGIAAHQQANAATRLLLGLPVCND